MTETIKRKLILKIQTKRNCNSINLKQFNEAKVSEVVTMWIVFSGSGGELGTSNFSSDNNQIFKISDLRTRDYYSVYF